MIFEHQVLYLEQRVKDLAQKIDPKKSAVLERETKKKMDKIKHQAVADFETQVNGKRKADVKDGNTDE